MMSKVEFTEVWSVLNIGHYQGDQFKIPHKSLEKANLTAINLAFKH